CNLIDQQAKLQFFNIKYTSTIHIFSLSLHDALPIFTQCFPDGQKGPTMIKQSIFGRISQLAKANINAMLDAAEDPQKMMDQMVRSEEHTSELQSRENLVCRLLLEKKNMHI